MSAEQTERQAFSEWAVLELMGHRRLGGLVSEATIAGAPFVRIDIPAAGEVGPVTQFYAPHAVYAITPTTEEIACAIAARAQHQPVSRYELPDAKPRSIVDTDEEGPF